MLRISFQLAVLSLVLLSGASHAGSKGQEKRPHHHEATNDDLKTAQESLAILGEKLLAQNHILINLIDDTQKAIAEFKALQAKDSSEEETLRIIQRRKALMQDVKRLTQKIPAQEDIVDNLDRAHVRETERVKALERALEKK